MVLFAVPGAFTPTCHKNHLPGFVKNAGAIKGKGIDTIAVTGVNDVFVMDAWKKASGGDAIEFLADGSANWAKALGLTADLTERGLGVRSQRYAMLVDDGVVKTLNRRGRSRQGRYFRRRQFAEVAVRTTVRSFRTRVRLHRPEYGSRESSRSTLGPRFRGDERSGIIQGRTTLPAARMSAIASRANSSARSFMSCPAWPFTQCQRI